MPLIHGKSQKAFEKNIKTEMEHGKPMKQSLAIAYAVKRKAQHKAKGGYMEKEKTEAHENFMEHEAKESAAHEAAEHMAMGGSCYAEGGFIGSHQNPKQPHYDADFADMSHDKEEMASGYPPEAGNYAKGGNVKKKMAKDIVSGPSLTPVSGSQIQKKIDAKIPLSAEERKFLENRMKETLHFEPYELERKKDSYAHGGMIDKIMAKKMPHYSHGGVVANDTDMDFAKKESAEYDYLVKQGGDSFHYTGANSGDELSTSGEVSRKEAMLKKIMASRAKKDKMPYYP